MGLGLRVWGGHSPTFLSKVGVLVGDTKPRGPCRTAGLQLRNLYCGNPRNYDIYTVYNTPIIVIQYRFLSSNPDKDPATYLIATPVSHDRV